MTDQSLREAAATHPALKNYDAYFDRMLENPGYLFRLLCFCQASGIPFSGKWLKVLGVGRMPEMSEKWMEYFLQGFLFDDADSYQITDQYRSALNKQLKKRDLQNERMSVSCQMKRSRKCWSAAAASLRVSCGSLHVSIPQWVKN